MNLAKKFTLLVIAILPTVAYAQHVPLHWYTLKSVIDIDAAEGKEALTIIREFTTDSLSSFTDKSNQFKLATKTEVDLNLLADVLNDAGFYIADITNSDTHPVVYERSGTAFQSALLFVKDFALFVASDIAEVKITKQEFSALSEEYQSVVLNSGVVTVQEK